MYTRAKLAQTHRYFSSTLAKPRATRTRVANLLALPFVQTEPDRWARVTLEGQQTRK